MIDGNLSLQFVMFLLLCCFQTYVLYVYGLTFDMLISVPFQHQSLGKLHTKGFKLETASSMASTDDQPFVDDEKVLCTCNFCMGKILLLIVKE